MNAPFRFFRKNNFWKSITTPTFANYCKYEPSTSTSVCSLSKFANVSTETTNINNTSISRNESQQIEHSVNVSDLPMQEKAPQFSSQLKARLEKWIYLLGRELEAEIVRMKQDARVIAMMGVDCRYKLSFPWNSGVLIELNFAKALDKKQLHKISTLFRKGFPLSLSVAGVKEIDDKHPLKYEAIINYLTCTSITLQLLCKKDPFKGTELTNAIFKLELSDEFSPFKRLIRFLGEREKIPTYPGYDIFLHTYKEKEMKVPNKDVALNLPEQFNKEQCAAIAAALNESRNITAIHGPPGTGKTKVIAQIISELIHRQKTVLVCASTHQAINNIQSYCAGRNLQQLWTRMKGLDNPFTRSFEYLKDSHPNANDLKKIYAQINGSKPDSAETGRLYNMAKALENSIVNDIVEDTSILYCTFASFHVHLFFRHGFSPDVIILDEVGQAMQCQVWPLLLQARRAIVVGDHHQLPPIIQSYEAKKSLSISLIEHIAAEFGPVVCFPLTEQYRFNTSIQAWPNQIFYQQTLKAHPSVEEIRLKDLKEDARNCRLSKAPLKDVIDSEQSSIFDCPLVLVDTDIMLSREELGVIRAKYRLNYDGNELFEEQFLPHYSSICNYGEAIVCAAYIQSLIKIIPPSQVGCITSYTAQVRTIKSYLTKGILDKLDVSSVDAFQGQEREAIVMSFVRDNWTSSLGFMREFRRLNVAVTRAKRQFTLVASSRMLECNETLSKLYEVIKQEGIIVSPSDVLGPHFRENGYIISDQIPPVARTMYA